MGFARRRKNKGVLLEALGEDEETGAARIVPTRSSDESKLAQSLRAGSEGPTRITVGGRVIDPKNMSFLIGAMVFISVMSVGLRMLSILV